MSTLYERLPAGATQAQVDAAVMAGWARYGETLVNAYARKDAGEPAFKCTLANVDRADRFEFRAVATASGADAGLTATVGMTCMTCGEVVRELFSFAGAYSLDELVTLAGRHEAKCAGPK